MFHQRSFLPTVGRYIFPLFIISGRSPSRGGFALLDPYLVPEVLVVELTLEVEGLALEAVGALPLTEVAFLALPSFMSAARPLHILVHVAAARVLLFPSWALTTGGGPPAAPGLAQ